MAAAAAERAQRANMSSRGFAASLLDVEGRDGDVGVLSTCGGSRAASPPLEPRNSGAASRLLGSATSSRLSPPRSVGLSATERLAELSSQLEELGVGREGPRDGAIGGGSLGGGRFGGAAFDGARLGGSLGGSLNGGLGGGDLGGGSLGDGSGPGGSCLTGAALDVRGDGASRGTSFAAASESLGWLRSDSHEDRLRRLREKYGYNNSQ